MALDREVIPADDSTGSTTVVSNSTGGLAIDYSHYFDRIAISLETIAANSTTVATNVAAIKQLAAGNGIHTLGPIDWVGLISVYKLYVEDADAIGLEKLLEYKAKIDALPKNF